MIKGRTVRENVIRTGNGRKYRIGNAFVFTENKVYSYQCTWMTYNCRRRVYYGPHEENFMTDFDLDETTSFLEHVYLGCTQSEYEPNEDIVEQDKDMFE